MAHDRVRSGTCVNAARTKFVNYRFGNRRPIIAAHVARDNISDKLRQATLRNGLCRLVGRVRKFIDLVNGPSSQLPSLHLEVIANARPGRRADIGAQHLECGGRTRSIAPGRNQPHS